MHCIWVAFTVFPVAWIFLSSVKPSEQVFAAPPLVFRPTLDNYLTLFGLIPPKDVEGASADALVATHSPFPRYLWNSALVSALTAGIAVTLGTMASYALTRYRVRGSGPLMLGLLATRMIPPITLLIPTYMLMQKVGLLDTPLALLFVYTSFALPMAIWMLRGFLLGIPTELDEAAMVDGCSRMGALFRIVLPLAAPGVASTAIFCILTAWNEFLYAMMLTSEKSKTLPAAIAGFITDKAILWGCLYAAGFVVILPMIIFTLLMQKHLTKGLTMGAVRN